MPENSGAAQSSVDINNIAVDLNGKADVDGLNMAASVKKMDGQWVSSYGVFASSVTWDNTVPETTYSLAEYLPSDGYTYEVMFCGTVSVVATLKNFVAVELYSDILAGSSDPVIVSYARTTGTEAGVGRGSVAIPVGPGRYVKQYHSDSSNANGTYSLYAVGYRRIGTNE